MRRLKARVTRRRSLVLDKHVFNCLLNWQRLSDDRSEAGSLFQSRGPATSNDLSPRRVLDHGKWRMWWRRTSKDGDLPQAPNLMRLERLKHQCCQFEVHTASDKLNSWRNQKSRRLRVSSLEATRMHKIMRDDNHSTMRRQVKRHDTTDHSC